MEVIVLIILALCLFTMFYQDLKYREIHVALPIIMFTACIYLLILNKYGSSQIVSLVLYNMGFLIATFLILILYMSIKNKAFLNPFKNYFGAGDLLFYLGVTPLFLIHNYLLFFILSMVFSIILFYIFKRVLKKDTIPLAGYASLLLVFIIGKDLFLNSPAITLIK